jgi:hypothetical protein
MIRYFMRRRDDEGVALITAIMVMLVLLAFGSVIAVLGVNNLRNANADRQANSSLGAGDAGVASAIEYIRSNGVAALNCPDANPSSCSTNPAGYSNPSNPKLVPLDSAGVGCNTGNNNCAKVWIGVVSSFSPPVVTTGTYNIHSEGIYGNGPSARKIVVTVDVTPDKYPIGVFGQTVTGNGDTAVLTESLFTTGCVSPRNTGSGNGTRFTGIDAYWGQPAAAHTTDHVSTKVGCSNKGYIASGDPTSSTPSAANCPDNVALNSDQSINGGLVSSSVGSACYHTYHRPDGSWYPDGVCPSGATSPYGNGMCDTTAFTTADLNRYGYTPRGLTGEQYKALKARSKVQGTYNLTSGSISAAITTLLNSGVTSPVLYWNCTDPSTVCSGGGISLSTSNFPANTFNNPPSDTGSCSPMPIVTVVVEHGNLTFQGGNSTWFDAAMFVPDGSFSGNGGYNLLGTMFSNNLSLGGNQTFSLDSCWVTSFPGAVLYIKQKHFREDDATDVP